MSNGNNRRNTSYVSFFLGTPKRFLGTLAGLLVGLAMIRPDLAERAIQNAGGAVLRGISPLVEPALTLAIMFFGAMLVFRAAFPKKKSSSKS